MRCPHSLTGNYDAGGRQEVSSLIHQRVTMFIIYAQARGANALGGVLKLEFQRSEGQSVFGDLSEVLNLLQTL